VPLVEEDPVHHSFHRLVNGRVVEDDVGRLPAQLHRHPLVGPRNLTHDALADLGGAGERDLRCDRMTHHQGAGLARAADDIHHPRRQISFLQQLGELERRHRRRLRRLQDHTVPSRQSRRDLPCKHQQREVPRDHLPDDAQGQRLPPRNPVLELVRPAGVIEEMSRRHRDVEVTRLLDRLPAVHRLRHRELAGAILNETRDSIDVFPALPPRHLPPHRVERPLRRLVRRVNVLGVR
jgi:hypothetical protein